MDNLESIKKDKNIKSDRLRFTKNKIPSILAYIAIIFDVLYFISIYKTNNDFFYGYKIGISIIINLLFLLSSFLCSEGIKNYKKEYAITMLIIGLVQFARIFFFPVQAHATEIVEKNEVVGYVIETPQFIRCVVYLIGSSACMIIGGVIGYLKTVRLENYTKSLNK